MLSLNTGDTGFVMLCTALVCMMTPCFTAAWSAKRTC